MFHTLRWIAALALALSLSACTGGMTPPPPSITSTPDSSPSTSSSVTASATTPPRATPAPKPKLEFRGDCDPTGGTVVAEASGFTPGGEYLTEVWRDGDNRPYTGFNNLGHFDSQGGMSSWKWECKDEKPGKYSVRITDRTAKAEAGASFRIYPTKS